MKKLKIYLDTSIINFVTADDAPEKKYITIEFFDRYVIPAKYDVYISPVVIDEIGKTKKEKRKSELLDTIKKYPVRVIDIEPIKEEIEQLAYVYIQKGIIPKNKLEDALHIAITTIEEMDILLSWNFRHLANVNKEMKIHAINLLERYTKEFRMITPMEVISDDE